MVKSIILIIIGLAIIFSGCIGSKDVTPAFKAIPEVQQFLSEHPTAKITTTYWSKEEVEKSANEISQQCGQTITPEAMYKAMVSEGDLMIISWINAKNQIVICSTAAGSDAASSKATPAYTTVIPLVTASTVTSTPAILSEKQKLQSDINNAPYNISEYKENIFDCSNMAALLHDWLETQTQTKWKVEVWFGCESPACKEGHEWLEVTGKESNYTIEVTSKKIVDYLGNSNKSYREYYSYFNRHYSSLPKTTGGYIEPRENIYPKRW